MDRIILIIATFYVVMIVSIILILNFIQSRKNKKYKMILDQLEIEKNQINSAPIIPELSKIENYLKNDKIETLYKSWKERLDSIRNEQISKITDMLIDSEYSLSQMDYRSAMYKIAKLEMEIYKAKTNSEMLLEEIKEITSSEEKNRAIITKLKTKYRELYQKFVDTQNEFGIITESVSLQFENIAKRFESFEVMMENNEYTEVTQIIKSIDEMLVHMEVVIEEVPSIVLTADSVLPKRIRDVEDMYHKMTRAGFPLDYLNVEYNIEEANRKINDILDRAKVLNLEDSLFELKVLLDYFDSLMNDFEKEKILKKEYDEANAMFRSKLNKTSELVTDIFIKFEEIKKIYNLSEEDIISLNEVRVDLMQLKEDYKVLTGHTGNNTFAYSKLIKEMETLSIKLASIEERLDACLDTLGSMREDEVRARQQLEEIKQILKDSKAKLREYNLPVVPKSYFTELEEAQAAIKEIIKELEKKPITISILNTRVDTARDLVLKLYSKTKELLKTAMFAEMAIVYGNRFRTKEEDLDKNLGYSEMLFYKGDYGKSLEISINALNRIDSEIYNKLLSLYEK